MLPDLKLRGRSRIMRTSDWTGSSSSWTRVMYTLRVGIGTGVSSHPFSILPTPSFIRYPMGQQASLRRKVIYNWFKINEYI